MKLLAVALWLAMACLALVPNAQAAKKTLVIDLAYEPTTLDPHK